MPCFFFSLKSDKLHKYHQGGYNNYTNAIHWSHQLQHDETIKCTKSLIILSQWLVSLFDYDGLKWKKRWLERIREDHPSIFRECLTIHRQTVVSNLIISRNFKQLSLSWSILIVDFFLSTPWREDDFFLFFLFLLECFFLFLWFLFFLPIG